MLKSHLLRLTEAAQALGINIKLSADELKQAVYSVIKANNIEEASIRITLTRGNSQKRSFYENLEQANLLISMAPLDIAEISEAQEGVAAISGEDRRGAFSQYKNSSMLSSIMAYKQARDNGAFDIIQVSKRGFVTEASRYNVFVVLDGIILTPSIGPAVLSGITRKLVINIAKRNGFKVEEDAVMGQDLVSCEEIFLTNSLFEVVPVTSLKGQLVANGQKGAITRQIQKGYRLIVDNWLEQIGLTASLL
jgi:branched-subunit amino acid aminotransferase/4-amino-4-deoxychorismate lyase